MTAEPAEDGADNGVPTAAPRAARPTAVHTGGRLRASGPGAGSAATRRGTEPAMAAPARAGVEAPRRPGRQGGGADRARPHPPDHR
ncbi:hypothetical protein ABZT03_14805 [Streptomyces sp. NPDC005574]|uniref:hypothetical protein n=1 Tax=Streptomyces sp. NPDC005574 TaxID=3156891 RepID=UPI0033BC9AD2